MSTSPARYDTSLLQPIAALLLDPLAPTRADPRRLRLLATLLLLIAPVLLLIVVMPTFTDPAYNVFQDIGFWPSVVTFGVLALAYALVRLGYYHLPVALMVGAITSAMYVLAIIDTTGTYAATLELLFVPLLLVSFLLPAAWSLAFAFLNLILLLLLPTLADHHHLLLEGILNGPVSLLLLTAVLIVPMTYFREHTQREREAELREGESRFRQMVAFYPDMVAVHSEGRYVYINEAGLRLLGAQDPAQIIGQWVADFIHPDYRDDISARMVRGTGREGVSIQTSEQMLRLDGTSVRVRVISMPTRYAGRLATQMFVRPIEKHSEEHSEERGTGDGLPAASADQRYARIFDSNVIGISLTGLEDGRFIDVNRYFAERLGYTREQMIGSTTLELGMWSDSGAREEMIAALRDATTYHRERFLLRTQDGQQRAARVTMELIDMGDGPCVLTLAQDVTAQYEIEQALQASENRYRQVSQLMTDYTYYLCVNDAGDIRLDWVAGAFEAITGYRPREQAGWGDWERLVHPEDRPRLVQHLRRVTGGQARQIEYRVITRSGAVRWLQQYDRPEQADDATGAGRITGIYGAARDVTDRLTAEQALRVHALQQAVVAELGQRALERSISEDTLHDEAVRLVSYVLSADACALWLLDASGAALVLRSITDSPDDAPLQTGHRVPLSYASSRVVQSLHATAPVVIPDLAAEPGAGLPPYAEQARSLVTIAVYGHDQQPIGVLAAQSAQADYFSMEDANFMQSVANVIAAFIEQRRAEQAERDQRLLAEALRETAAYLNSTLDLETVLDRILDHLALVIPYDTASIMLLNEPGTRIIRHRGFERYGVSRDFMDQAVIPKGNSFVDEMLESGDVIVIPDVRQDPRWYTLPGTEYIRAYMGVPISVQGEVMGIINVDSGSAGAFTQRHAERLTAFVDQAGIALNNARHAEELQNRVAERTAALNLEHNRLQTILDASGEGIFYAENHSIYYANQAMGAILGCDPASLSGEPVTRFIDRAADPSSAHKGQLDPASAPPLDWDALMQRLEAEPIIRQDARFRRTDGQAFHAGLTLSRVGPAGPARQVVVIVRDVSQAKALEAQKSRFIANASHELRTPLASLKLRLYMLNRDPDRMETHLAQIEHVTERMSSLVEDLLDHGRFERGAITLHRVDLILQSVVEDALELNELQAQSKGLRFTGDLDSSHPLHIFADFDRMLQVFTNLIGNAVHYTPSGGSVHTQVYAESTGQVAWACVAVRDDGPGIPEKDQQHIFEPFVRRSKDLPGTGLGLSIAYEIVAAHGGRIDLDSAEGEGSTFTVRLPLARMTAPGGG